MHITKRNGMRFVSLTEEDFETVMDGFNRLIKLANYPDRIDNLASIENADMVLTSALAILATDDGANE